MKPFTNVSMTGTGAAVLIITIILQLLGVEVVEGSVQEVVVAAVEVVSFAMVIAGQLRRKDLRFGFLRR